MHRTAGRQPVVVGVDGSPASIDALIRAARIADRLSTRLVAITVWHEPIGAASFLPMPPWSARRNAADVLAIAVRQAFGSRPPRGLVEQALEGMPVPVLLEATADAEMLVLGSRGHGGLVGMMLGSVSAACAERARCPVLILHAHDVDATRQVSLDPADATPEALGAVSPHDVDASR